MHDSSYKFMTGFVKNYVKNGDSVLDVGSYNFNGCYRPLFQECKYVGLDLESGPNVDIVIKDAYQYPFPDNNFDIIICGQCLEHSFHPWKVVNEIGRVTKKCGFACLIAPWQWPIHRFPVDCFRILPDGMNQIMKDAGFEVLTCYATESRCIGKITEHDYSAINLEGDCYGIGKKL